MWTFPLFSNFNFQLNHLYSLSSVIPMFSDFCYHKTFVQFSKVVSQRAHRFNIQTCRVFHSRFPRFPMDHDEFFKSTSCEWINKFHSKQYKHPYSWYRNSLLLIWSEGNTGRCTCIVGQKCSINRAWDLLPLNKILDQRRRASSQT